MYPTVVIVLVETHRSMADICEVGLSDVSNFAGSTTFEARPATLGHLSFADGTTYSTMDSESESQRPRVSQSQDGQEYCLEKDILEIKESDWH